MVTKRTHSVMDVVHPSRQSQVPSTARPSKKPRRMEPAVHKKQLHASSVNTIKKRIRDVRRRLERSENLPATVRAENERALAAYEQELTAADEEKTRQKMIKKYHMVRFFERQKATRQLKKLRKQLIEAQSDGELTVVKAKIHVAEVDLNYTQYYPLYQRYISLYPQKVSDGNDTGSQVEDSTKKPPMWAEVERRMVDGTLNRLRNDSSTITASHAKSASSKTKPKKTKASSALAKLNGTSTNASRAPVKLDEAVTHLEHRDLDQSTRKARRQLTKATQDDESDGGFFEE